MRHTAVILAAAVLSLAACSQDGPRAHPLEGGDAPAGGGKPADPHGGLPVGHPPMDAPAQPAGPIGGPAAGPGMAPPAPGTASFSWTAPATWKDGGASGMRAGQWEVPGAAAGESPVQVVVFSGLGGSAEANIDRWTGMVTQADGSSSKAKAKITTASAGGVKITRIEIRGGYSSNMGTPVNFADALFIGVVVEQAGVNTAHVRFVGPPAVVEKEAANFDAFVASFVKK